MSTALGRPILVLAAIALPASSAVADVTIPNSGASRAPAPRPTSIRDACEVMRRTADWTKSTHKLAWPHLADRRVEQVLRRFYARQVLTRGIDDRSLANHPLVFERNGTAPGVTVAPCVEEWRAADPSGTVPGTSPRFAADHQYAEVDFEFNDASDGEHAYTAFVDVATLQVVAMFYYSNFEP